MTILQFSSSGADLQTAGGKGANLARLTRAGFAVPPGFIIPTSAYRAFVAVNHLADVISAAIAESSVFEAAQAEAASARIRAAFAAGTVPGELEAAIRAAYADLNSPPVAVRSSATAEDLPDLSFAGQQDTFLNVIGAEALLTAVVACWSSLWTARAIGYRVRNQIDQAETALAVVVQAMVPSEVSGVLFTANPLTGLLSESVLEATLGLGEALVSGQVEPDQFVVQSASGEVLQRTLGAKAVSIRGKVGGGVEVQPEAPGARPTLSAAQVRQLAALGQQVHREFGAPQDIEWALAEGRIYLLQARPITSLFPVPTVSFDPLILWFAFGAVQGVMGPITPLGRDAIRLVLSGGGALFGQRLNVDDTPLFAPAGERLWVRISDVIRHPVGNRVFRALLGYIEPSIGQILGALATDPRLGAGAGRLKWSTVKRVAHFARPVLPGMVGAALQPEARRAQFDADLEAYLKTAALPPAQDRFEQLANLVAFLRERLAGAFPFLLPRFVPMIGPSMAALNLLNHLAGPDHTLALEVTRGMANNVTTQMDLALWETAMAIRADAEAARIFREAEAATLARRYLAGALPPAAQAAIAHFLARYGMRGVGEIDLGRPRWREDPTPVMHTLRSYLQIDREFAPDVVFARGEQAAQAAIDKLAARARGQVGGRLREALVRGAARRLRALMGARESPKFFAIRTMGIARQALLAAGQAFVAAGALERPDDLVYLYLDELEALARGEPRDWQALVGERRTVYAREERRRQVPRVLASDGRAFYDGVGAATDSDQVITGSPVSPGVVEGRVQVVLDPHGAQLAPGEILVCPGTDPAWTPLFLAAGGLVTEVGGMMTHGSVVAREYGIPAVVGVHQATRRLQTGQRIRVDGTAGQVVILSP